MNQTKGITFSDILIRPQYSEILSRSNVDLSSDMEKFTLGLPVISANMRHITGPKMALEMNNNEAMGILHRFNSIKGATEELFEFNPYRNPRENVGVSIGVQEEDKERFDALYETGARIFCIDVAHGHHVLMKNMIGWINSKGISDISIIAGNIATKEAAEDLQEWGADILKVGIGPGAVCMTRRNTGVGVPQFSALQEVSSVAKVPIIADGGVTCVGDIAKCLIYSDAVMIGSFIAGASETPGNVFRDDNGNFYKVYGGSASGETKLSNEQESKFVEGITKTVPFQGHIKHILREIKQGLQSTFSYTGANNLKEFQAKVKWDAISGGGKQESKL